MPRELAVDGMHCASCATSVERFLEREPGVASASVSYGDGRATLALEPAADAGALLDALAELGYDASFVDEG